MAASQGAEKPGQSGHLRTEAEGVPLLGVGQCLVIILISAQLL